MLHKSPSVSLSSVRGIFVVQVTVACSGDIHPLSEVDMLVVHVDDSGSESQYASDESNEIFHSNFLPV